MSQPWLNPGIKVQMPDMSKLKMDGDTMTDVLTVGARATTNYLKKFYREKDGAEPNKLGGRRTHFWNRQIGGSTNMPVVEDTNRVVVSISSPILPHKVKGGTISAKRSKYLTIPLVAEAYGRRARYFDDLFVVKSKKGNLLLVKPDKPSKSKKHNAKSEAKKKLPNTKVRKQKAKPLGLEVKREVPTEKKENGFTPYYLLKKSVTQAPWPNSIPPEKVISEVAYNAMIKRFDRLFWRELGGKTR